MGSLIRLAVGQLEVDWQREHFIHNYSKLFLPSDRTDVPYLAGDEDYEYYEADAPVSEPAYSRRLESVVGRLELLGYNLTYCREQYDSHVFIDLYDSDNGVIPFDKFAKLLASIDVNNLRMPHPNLGWDLGEFTRKNIFKDPQFTRRYHKLAKLSRDDAAMFENIDPLVILRLLAENKKNLSENVVWRIQEHIDADWIHVDDIYEALGVGDRYLIVTEGKSDSAILKKSLDLLHPDIADFFTFIDM